MKKQLKINEIKPNPNNPRLIKNDKFKKLVKSIQEFPEMLKLRPIVVDEDMMVLGGNMRLKASKDAGLKEVWIEIAEGLTEEQKKEFIVKDNVGFGDWEWDMLANEWDSVQLAEWGLDVWENEDDKEPEAGLIEDDEIPEVKESKVKRGDIWKLGEHRVMCGDSTNIEDVENLMNGEKADMVFTDPPYELDVKICNNISKFTENSHLFTFNNDKNILEHIANSNNTFKKFFVFYHSACAIPIQGGHECFLEHILISHETKGLPIKFNNKYGIRTVIKGEYRRNNLHKHSKPIELLEKLIKGYSNRGFFIMDSFLGSGSTLIAAEKLNRKCYGMELDEKYCDVIINRWEQFTGQKAKKL